MQGDNALSSFRILGWEAKWEEKTLDMFKRHCICLWNSQRIIKMHAKIPPKGNIQYILKGSNRIVDLWSQLTTVT